MTRKKLLRQLAALPHAGRCRRMAEVGRSAQSPGPDGAEAAAILAEMRRGIGFERRMALQAGWGSRDPAVAVLSLADASRLVRTAALPLAAALCDGSALLDALDTANPAARRALLRQVRRRRRGALLDPYLQRLADRNDREFGALLHHGSAPFVARHLPAMALQAGLDWRALARAHPRLAAEHLTRMAAAADELDARTASIARVALPVLAEHGPDAALGLVRALARHVALGTLPLSELVRRRPAAVADLCLEADGTRLPPFAPVAHRLDQDRLLALLRRFGTLGGGDAVRWLRRLPPDRRGAVHALAGRGWRNAEGMVSLPLLMLLPQPVRDAEARRHLALPALQTRPAARLPYAALLPWEEAQAVLAPSLGDPEPDLRAVAWRAMAGCVQFTRSRAADLLTMALLRRHEQDPVRGSILGGMADLPPSTWQAAHLEALGTAFRHALDATDLSPPTAGHIERLLIALLPRHPGWAAGWLATFARERGALGAHGLRHRLRDTDVRRLAPALAPVLREWMAREREGQVFNLALRLGRRIRAWDGLTELVEQALSGTAGTAAAALRVLAATRPDRLDAIIPGLLRRDPSWITQPVVHGALHRRRQDLLTPFLGRKAYKGRFATGRTYIVLPLHAGFHRWTPTQQALFQSAIMGIIDDAVRDSPALIGAIAQLAALPDIAPDALVQLAALDNPRLADREAALRGLGRRDAGDGLPTLLAALDDERGRIAAYALRRCLLDLPAPAALAVLRRAPMGRVTVAKEVIRLAGDLGGDDAYGWLCAWDAEDLHRDVRVALLRALWSHLDKAATWAVLARAAGSPDPALATAVARLPATALSMAEDGRFSALLASLLGHGDPRVRAAALARCAAAPLADQEQALLGPMLASLASPLPDECRLAADAVFATYAGRRAARVGEAARTVRHNRRAVAVLVLQLRRWARRDQQRCEPTVQAVLDALQPDPVLSAECAGLAAASLPAPAAAAWFDQARPNLHPEALWRAVEVLETRGPRELAGLAVLEAAMAGSADERLRRLALAALRGQAEVAQGWTNARLVRLEAFRADPAPLVAGAAQFTFPPDQAG